MARQKKEKEEVQKENINDPIARQKVVAFLKAMQQSLTKIEEYDAKAKFEKTTVKETIKTLQEKYGLSKAAIKEFMKAHQDDNVEEVVTSHEQFDLLVELYANNGKTDVEVSDDE